MVDLLIVTGMVAAACVGNLLLKIGTRNGPSDGFLAFLDWRILFGLTLFALSAVFYLLLLRRMPLNVAQSMMALQFVAVIIGSYAVLGEPLPALRLVGVCLITLGILLVAASHSGGR